MKVFELLGWIKTPITADKKCFINKKGEQKSKTRDDCLKNCASNDNCSAFKWDEDNECNQVWLYNKQDYESKCKDDSGNFAFERDISCKISNVPRSL